GNMLSSRAQTPGSRQRVPTDVLACSNANPPMISATPSSLGTDTASRNSNAPIANASTASSPRMKTYETPISPCFIASLFATAPTRNRPSAAALGASLANPLDSFMNAPPATKQSAATSDRPTADRLISSQLYRTQTLHGR